MSKITLNTQQFNSLLSRAVKGSAKGGIDMTADLLEIKMRNGMLSLRTTDTRNTMVLKMAVPGVSDEFVAVIQIEQFQKIVSKTSKETIELNITDSAVELRGNGTYKFPLVIEGDAPVALAPIPLITDAEITQTLSKKEIATIVANNGAFVGSQFVDPAISGYYFGPEAVITTDFIGCCYYKKKFFSEPIMFYPTTLQLILELEEDDITFLKKDRHIQFYTQTGLIDSVTHLDVDAFPAEDLMAYIKDAYTAGVTVSKKQTKEVLERIGLFVDMKTEFGAADMVFEADGIHLSDKRKNANEVIPYKQAADSSQTFKPFSGTVPTMDLIRVLNIEGEDDITLWYDCEQAVRVDVENTTRVLALLDEEQLDSSSAFAQAEAARMAEAEAAEQADINAATTFADVAQPVSMEDVEW